MASEPISSLVTRSSHRLMPDATRVLPRMFVAGRDDLGSRQSRAGSILERVLSLTDEQVQHALEEVRQRFADRHEDLTFWFDAHAHRVANRVDPTAVISPDRWRLIGAFFTHEFSVEGASLSNPSVVLHPDQGGLPEGNARFLMSVRGIGEGHRSSIGFRTGVMDRWGGITVDPPRPSLTEGIHREALLKRDVIIGMLKDLGDYGENAQYVLEQLGEVFTVYEVEDHLVRLLHESHTYRNAETTVLNFRSIIERVRAVSFDPETDVSERILWPYAEAECRGMEDARFVRFTDEDGSVVYRASYTAFNGETISQHMLSTTDFLSFEVSPISGTGAGGKGLALFPRRIDGRYVALSRHDHESNWIAFSTDTNHWDEVVKIQTPSRSWELIQMGNSGSPIETEAGWLVLTHAVGPMRTYCISAMLLDRIDPTRVIGTLEEPLLSPSETERNGYVPNVLYSCGAMMHDGMLLVPFGIADNCIGFATVPVKPLLERLARH